MIAEHNRAFREIPAAGDSNRAFDLNDVAAPGPQAIYNARSGPIGFDDCSALRAANVSASNSPSVRPR